MLLGGCLIQGGLAAELLGVFHFVNVKRSSLVKVSRICEGTRTLIPMNYVEYIGYG